MTDEDVVDFRADEFDERGCEPILLFWYLEEGDPIEQGQELCEIESAKAAFVLTSPATGTLAEICVRETEPVGSGQLLARIRTSRE